MDLPLRETEITIEVEPGLRFVMEPLTDEQFLRLNETARIETGEPDENGAVQSQVRWSMAPGASFFADRLRRIDADEPLTVAGEPFSRGNPAHLASLKPVWKAEALVGLFRYARGLDAEQLGN